MTHGKEATLIASEARSGIGDVSPETLKLRRKVIHNWGVLSRSMLSKDLQMAGVMAANDWSWVEIETIYTMHTVTQFLALVRELRDAIDGDHKAARHSPNEL